VSPSLQGPDRDVIEHLDASYWWQEGSKSGSGESEEPHVPEGDW
jgi:hypothetical protein